MLQQQQQCNVQWTSTAPACIHVTAIYKTSKLARYYRCYRIYITYYKSETSCSARSSHRTATNSMVICVNFQLIYHDVTENLQINKLWLYKFCKYIQTPCKSHAPTLHSLNVPLQMRNNHMQGNIRISNL